MYGLLPYGVKVSSSTSKQLVLGAGHQLLLRIKNHLLSFYNTKLEKTKKKTQCKAVKTLLTVSEQN